MAKELHTLVRRQLKKYHGADIQLSDEWKGFIDAVSDAYCSFDSDRELLEHSIELSSKELFESNQKMKTMLQDLQKTHNDLKNMKMQLFQSEKMASIGQLAAGVAHEINNPVGFIESNIEVLEGYVKQFLTVIHAVQELKEKKVKTQTDLIGPAIEKILNAQETAEIDYILSDITNLFKETKDGVRRVKNIVADLRVFSKADEEGLEDVDLKAIIEETIRLAFNEIKYKAGLNKEFDPDLPLIKGRKQRLQQVFLNLLVNAAQAIKEKGEIFVKVYRKDEYIYAEISDTGVGIAEENLKKMFDPFFTTKPVGQGTGLGLSISYDIIKKHGGEISVESVLGKGTTFIIMLPINHKDN
ncbi:MAG: sensor histidine kinase [Candidatus Omnitrophota bacterium]